MASAVCQNQFLGSRISLISKSEIRYEGILYALDLCEATISLAKVCSFGTEDRPTERPIPGKDEVFEYIIFRGSDIKVIDVVEPPKQAANSGNPGVPADPAIVDFSHSNGNGHYGNHFDGGRMRPNNNNNSRSNNGGPGPMFNGPITPNGGMRRRSGGFPNDGGMQNGNHNGRNMNMGGGIGGRQQYGPPGGRNNFGGYGNFRQGGFNPNNGGQFQQRGRMTTPNRGGNFGQPRRGRQQNVQGGNRTPFRSRGMSQAAFPPKVAFDGDYDFEKANEELLSSLAKAKLDDETTETREENTDEQAETKEGENENKEQRIFYKKDDFFDNISCESLERSKGNVPRVDWKAERKLNVETFGLNPNNNNINNNNVGGNNRINNRRNMGNGQNMMSRGGNMSRGPGNNGPWMMMSPNNFFRGGNRRQRIN